MEEEFTISDNRISLLTKRSEKPEKWCISLHGGGQSSKETSEYLSSAFLENEISFLSFDHSGQGKSQGLLSDSSLERRFSEAMGIIDRMGSRPSFLVGTSMGGYIAMKIVESLDIRNLILFCPAAYSKSAWNLKFGSGFTDEIRRKDSFLESDVEEICENFNGNVLLVYGNDDNVIPLQVQNSYSVSFSKAKYFKRISIPNCPHPIHRWIQNDLKGKSQLLKEVGDFVEKCI